jgi:hypothetical protein
MSLVLSGSYGVLGGDDFNFLNDFNFSPEDYFNQF